MQLAAFETPQQRNEHPIAGEIREAILIADANRPRSTQVAIGPSQLGHPCVRRLAYKLMGHPECNANRTTVWGAVIGTSVHATLAEAFAQVNDRLGRIRYLVEQRVEIRPGLRGTCDLYDFDRATAVDFKIVSPAALKEYKLTDPGPTYRVQGHGYGTGITRLGLPVAHIAIAFLPRAADISGMHVWTEPYNPQIVTDALARHDATVELICQLDVEHHPQRYTLIPRTANRLCLYCPYFKAGPDTGVTCPGDTNVTAPAA